MEKLAKFQLIIIIISFLLFASTLGAWYISKSLAERETTKLFNDEADIIESWITNRLETYKTIAYGFQAFWTGSEVVTQKEWESYAETLKISERFPGITGIDLIQRKDDSSVVTFVYPLEREGALGANLTIQPGRLEAINRAIETASPAFTSKVLLLADQKPGFVMYVPVYKTGVPVDTIEERRVAVKGLVALTFRSEQVFKDLFDAHDTFPRLDFEFYKGRVLEENYILYDHDYTHYIPKGEPRNTLETKRTIASDGETFTLLVAAKSSFGLTILEEQLPNIVLILGLVFSFLIFIFGLSGFRKLQKKTID
ncbi:MAG: CHASE domain-containing protein [Patescibacteria group bacterium]